MNFADWFKLRGFTPPPTGTGTKYLDDKGLYSTPAGGGGSTWTYSAYSTDAAFTAAADTYYLLDLSGLTADRLYTLPATAAVGARVAFTVVTGSTAFGVGVTANTGDTLDGAAAAAVGPTLRQVGEGVVLICTVANTTWETEVSRSKLYKRRERLQANRTYYVRTTGSDINLYGTKGLADTAASAFASWQGAFNWIKETIDFSGYTVTIQAGAASNTFTAGLVFSSWTGGGALNIHLGGGTTGQSSAGNTFTALVLLPGTVTISNGTITNSVSAACVTAQNNSALTVGASVVFGAAAGGYHMAARFGGRITANTAYSYTGGAVAHLWADASGSIQSSSITVTGSGTIAFTYFVLNLEGGLIYATGNTYTGGTITGQRFFGRNKTLIYTNLATANSYFPGSTAGSVDASSTHDMV